MSTTSDKHKAINRSDVQHVRAAFNQMDIVEQRAHEMVAKTFRKGMRVKWKRGAASIQSGAIIRASRDRVLVKSDGSGREYWIYVQNIFRGFDL